MEQDRGRGGAREREGWSKGEGGMELGRGRDGAR